MQVIAIIQVLVLLGLANGTPVIAKRLMGDRWAWPLDGGVRLADGRPLFGHSKTVRGLVLGVLATMLGAPLIGIDMLLGFWVGVAALGGDLVSSFTKRRMNLQSSSRALGLDQVPESLFPALVCAGPLGLGLAEVAMIVAVFFVGSLVLSRLLFAVGVRDRPH